MINKLLSRRLVLSFVVLQMIFLIGCGQKQKVEFDQKTNSNRIDIGGFSLYSEIQGEGSPTVIFESGGGDNSSVWQYVQPEIAKITRTFVYDRAGLGKSDKSPNPRTSMEQVRELRVLLEKAKVKPPYIFVTNSYGAFISKIYANLYPEEVSGVVFVDGTNEKLAEFAFENLSFLKLMFYKFMTRKEPDGSFNEFYKSGEEVKEAEKHDGMRNTPVIVLTSDVTITAKQFANSPFSNAISEWMNWQKELVALSNKSKQYIIYGSGHMIHKENPKVVIDAIKRLLKSGYGWSESYNQQELAISLLPDKMRQFVGRYQYSADEVLTIKEENERFFAYVPNRMVAEILPVSDQKIVMKDLDMTAELKVQPKPERDILVIKGKYYMDTIVAPRVDANFQTPIDNLNNGKIDDAIATYKEIHSTDPLNTAILETRLNLLGYNLLNSSKINEAIALFKLNTEFYPESANAYDSFAEAYMIAGNKELAIKNYERSLELNPQNTNAAKQLKKLKN
jgi:pimeloyl-ACP methyl ester carboxylesterase